MWRAPHADAGSDTTRKPLEGVAMMGEYLTYEDQPRGMERGVKVRSKDSEGSLKRRGNR